MYKIVLWFVVFFSLIPGVWADRKVSNDPTLKPWVKTKPLIHSLNDTDVHRLCQLLGCGDLVTNFTSTYNSSAVRHNYLPPNHPILDNPYAKWNVSNILDDVDFVENKPNNDSGIYWGEYEEEATGKNYEDDEIYWGNENEVSTTLEENHPSDVNETNDVNDEQLMDVEAVYIIIGCSTAVSVLLLAGILILLCKMYKIRVTNLQIQHEERNQQQLDIELLDFVSINLDEY